MDEQCVFCRRPLSGAGSSKEHVVPRALGGGGWLTTDRVCLACNSRLGADVDRVASAVVLRALRIEAGLLDVEPLPAAYRDEETGLPIAGRVLPDGSFARDERVYRRDSGVDILAPTGERAREIADRIVRRREERREPPIKFGDVTTAPGDAVLVRLKPEPFPPVAALLAREAAKIAVGYVACVGLPRAALDPRLDSLRVCALEGTQADVEEGYHLDPGARGVYLPRTRLSFLRGPAGSTPPSEEETAGLYATADGALRHSAAGTQPLTWVYHKLSFSRDGHHGSLHLTLFGLFYFGVGLPPKLDLPWNRYDYRDFSRGYARTGLGFRH